MLVCVVSGLCHGVSTQVEFCFLFLGVRVSPSFPFLLLGLCVCVRVCFRKSGFVLPAALAWFRFAGPSLPPSLPPSLLFSLPPSRPSLSGGRGPGVPGMSLVPPLSAHPAPSPRRPPASPWNVPPPPWNRVGGGGGIAALSWQPPGERSPGSSPFLCGRGRVASRRVARRRRLRAELGRLGGRRCGVPGGRRQRPVLGTFEPVVGSHLAAACILSLPLRSFGEPFRRVVTQPPGPRQSSQTPAMLAATVPVAPRPRDVLLSPEIGSLGF